MHTLCPYTLGNYVCKCAPPYFAPQHFALFTFCAPTLCTPPFCAPVLCALIDGFKNNNNNNNKAFTPTRKGSKKTIMGVQIPRQYIHTTFGINN